MADRKAQNHTQDDDALYIRNTEQYSTIFAENWVDSIWVYLFVYKRQEEIHEVFKRFFVIPNKKINKSQNDADIQQPPVFVSQLNVFQDLTTSGNNITSYARVRKTAALRGCQRHFEVSKPISGRCESFPQTAPSFPAFPLRRLVSGKED